MARLGFVAAVLSGLARSTFINSKRFQKTLKCSVLPGTEQSYRICPKSITGIKWPMSSIWAQAFFAINQRVAIVIEGYTPAIHSHNEVACAHLIPSLDAQLTHYATAKCHLPQYLANLPRCQGWQDFVGADVTCHSRCSRSVDIGVLPVPAQPKVLQPQSLCVESLSFPYRSDDR